MKKKERGQDVLYNEVMDCIKYAKEVNSLRYVDIANITGISNTIISDIIYKKRKVTESYLRKLKILKKPQYYIDSEENLDDRIRELNNSILTMKKELLNLSKTQKETIDNLVLIIKKLQN